MSATIEDLGRRSRAAVGIRNALVISGVVYGGLALVAIAGGLDALVVALVLGLALVLALVQGCSPRLPTVG